MSKLDVFVSYSSEDKAVADALVVNLEQNGIRCWYAPRDISAGSGWGSSIVEAIRECKVMVLVFSASANASVHVKSEVERAVHHQLHIIPFRIQSINPSGDMELFVSSRHWLDALPRPTKKHVRQLTETIQVILDQTPEKSDKFTVPFRKLGIAAVFILALTTAMALLWSKRDAIEMALFPKDQTQQSGSDQDNSVEDGTTPPTQHNPPQSESTPPVMSSPNSSSQSADHSNTDEDSLENQPDDERPAPTGNGNESSATDGESIEEGEIVTSAAGERMGTTSPPETSEDSGVKTSGPVATGTAPETPAAGRPDDKPIMQRYALNLYETPLGMLPDGWRGDNIVGVRELETYGRRVLTSANGPGTFSSPTLRIPGDFSLQTEFFEHAGAFDLSVTLMDGTPYKITVHPAHGASYPYDWTIYLPSGASKNVMGGWGGGILGFRIIGSLYQVTFDGFVVEAGRLQENGQRGLESASFGVAGPTGGLAMMRAESISGDYNYTSMAEPLGWNRDPSRWRLFDGSSIEPPIPAPSIWIMDDIALTGEFRLRLTPSPETGIIKLRLRGSDGGLDLPVEIIGNGHYKSTAVAFAGKYLYGEDSPRNIQTIEILRRKAGIQLRGLLPDGKPHVFLTKRFTDDPFRDFDAIVVEIKNDKYVPFQIDARAVGE